MEFLFNVLDLDVSILAHTKLDEHPVPYISDILHSNELWYVRLQILLSNVLYLNNITYDDVDYKANYIKAIEILNRKIKPPDHEAIVLINKLELGDKSWKYIWPIFEVHPEYITDIIIIDINNDLFKYFIDKEHNPLLTYNLIKLALKHAVISKNTDQLHIFMKTYQNEPDTFLLDIVTSSIQTAMTNIDTELLPWIQIILSYIRDKKAGVLRILEIIKELYWHNTAKFYKYSKILDVNLIEYLMSFLDEPDTLAHQPQLVSILASAAVRDLNIDLLEYLIEVGCDIQFVADLDIAYLDIADLGIPFISVELLELLIDNDMINKYNAYTQIKGLINYDMKYYVENFSDILFEYVDMLQPYELDITLDNYFIIRYIIDSELPDVLEYIVEDLTYTERIEILHIIYKEHIGDDIILKIVIPPDISSNDISDLLLTTVKSLTVDDTDFIEILLTYLENKLPRSVIKNILNNTNNKHKEVRKMIRSVSD